MSKCLHRYKKTNLGNNGKEYLVYRCTKPTCTHYIPLNQAEGKECECNRCGAPMTITKKSLWGSGGRASALPHCPACTKPRKDNNVAAIAEFLAKNNPGL